MASMTGLVNGVATTVTEVANGTLLVATTQKQADWNERFAKAYQTYTDAVQDLGRFDLMGDVTERRAARARVESAEVILDYLDMQAENILAEQEEEEWR